MTKIMEEKKGKYLHVLLIIVGSIFLGITVFHSNLWFDEAYTVEMVNHSFGEIWQIGANDVHPILYYWILHFLSLIFGNSILVYRLFSLSCFIILGILGFTHIRKDFGPKTGFLFSFLVFFLPTSASYAGEIRMYGLGLLLGTLLIIYAHRIYKENTSKVTIPLFGIYSLLLSYTHYYGLILAGIINLSLFIYLFLNREKRKKDFILFIIQAVLEVLLYLPWLFCFLGQLKNVSQGFWITLSFPMTLYEVLTVQFKGNLTMNMALILTGICYLYLLYHYMKMPKEKKRLPRLAIGIYIGIIILALGASLIMQSVVLLHRYLLIISGLILLAFSVIAASSSGKTGNILLSVLILAFSIYNTTLLIEENYSKNEGIPYLIEHIENEDIIIYSDAILGSVVTSRLSFDIDNPSYFYNKDNWNVEEAYKAFSTMTIVDEYESILNDYKGRIWVIESAGSNSFHQELQQTYHVELKSIKEFSQKYKNLNFQFTLLEKKN